MLAQAAEQQGDFAGADAGWRRSTIRSGRWRCSAGGFAGCARARWRGARTHPRRAREAPEDGRASCWSRSQLLRDAKRWGDAYDALAEAAERYPDDADLLYEQAMMAEKMDRLDDMERLLRQVIAIKPTISMPTTRSAIRSPIAASGCPRRAR